MSLYDTSSLNATFTNLSYVNLYNFTYFFAHLKHILRTIGLFFILGANKYFHAGGSAMKKNLINYSTLEIPCIIFLLLLVFFLIELFNPPIRFQVFFSILLLSGFFYTIYLSFAHKKLLEKKFFLIFCLLIIVNRLYDPVIFKNYFKFDISIGIIIVLGLALLRIFTPVLTSFIYLIKQNTAQKFSPNEPSENIPKKRNISQNHLSKVQEDICMTTEKKFINKTAVKTSFTEILVTIILLISSVWLTTKLFHWLMEYQNMDTAVLLQNVDAFIPIALIGIFATIIIFIVLCTYSKLIKVMINILKGDESPTIYVLGIAVISIFISKSGYFSQNKMFNLFTEGDIFSFPIAILIIYPFFILSANTIKRLLKDHMVYDRIKQYASTLAKKILTICYDIIDSTITIIEFITSDFLSSMLSIITESSETEKDESEVKANEK